VLKGADSAVTAAGGSIVAISGSAAAVGFAAAVVARGAGVAGFGEAMGLEFTNRFRSLCALRATWQPDNNSNNPIPRVCLTRLLPSFTTSSPFQDKWARTDERNSAPAVADERATPSVRRSSRACVLMGIDSRRSAAMRQEEIE